MSDFDAGWLTFWLVGLGGLFVVAETIAVRNTRNKRDTLSYNLHHLTRKVPFGGHLLVLAMAWLAWHFTIGRGTHWWPQRPPRDDDPA